MIKEEDLLRLWSEWVGTRKLSKIEIVAMDAALEASWLPPSGTLNHSSISKEYALFCEPIGKWYSDEKNWTNNRVDARTYKSEANAKKGIDYIFRNYYGKKVINFRDKSLNIINPKKPSCGPNDLNYDERWEAYHKEYNEYKIKTRNTISIVDYTVIL